MPSAPRMRLYEHRSEPLLPPRHFMRRLGAHGLVALALILVSLLIGILGYRFIVGLEWIDALLNSAMLLGGMGEIDPIRTDAGKVFASVYALFSGVVFLASASIFIAPIAHRILHSLHLDEPDSDQPR